MAEWSSVGTKAAAKYFRNKCPLKFPSRDEDCAGCDHSGCHDNVEELAAHIDGLLATLHKSRQYPQKGTRHELLPRMC